MARSPKNEKEKREQEKQPVNKKRADRERLRPFCEFDPLLCLFTVRPVARDPPVAPGGHPLRERGAVGGRAGFQRRPKLAGGGGNSADSPLSSSSFLSPVRIVRFSTGGVFAVRAN